MSRGASLEFEMVHAHDGEFMRYRGRLCGCEAGERIIDTQDEWNIRLHYWVSIRPERDRADWYQLTTKGLRNGGVRHRYGTLADMIEVAEKWAARRFRIVEIERGEEVG